MSGYPRSVCNGVVDNQPFLTALGWTLNVGIESEFFLLQADENGRPIVFSKDNQDKPSYDLKAMARVRDVLHNMESSLTACGFDVFQIDQEDASG